MAQVLRSLWLYMDELLLVKSRKGHVAGCNIPSGQAGGVRNLQDDAQEGIIRTENLYH
jgi:hypothetical protein